MSAGFDDAVFSFPASCRINDNVVLHPSSELKDVLSSIDFLSWSLYSQDMHTRLNISLLLASHPVTKRANNALISVQICVNSPFNCQGRLQGGHRD